MLTAVRRAALWRTNHRRASSIPCSAIAAQAFLMAVFRWHADGVAASGWFKTVRHLVAARAAPFMAFAFDAWLVACFRSTERRILPLPYRKT